MGILEKLIPSKRKAHNKSWLRSVVTGGLYRVSDMRSSTDMGSIRSIIDTMRGLAKDSQISTALSYYATDATTTNGSNSIIWATPVDANNPEAAEVVNGLIKSLEIESYARDHILELATIGNLYIPTSQFYTHLENSSYSRVKIGLDSNSIDDPDYRILPAYKIPPEDIVHLWQQGERVGFIYSPDDENATGTVVYPDTAVIHFALGGLLGDYTISAKDKNGNIQKFDIQFGQPLMQAAVQPTQTLSLLEDAVLLSSLIRVVRIINVDCNSTDELEIHNSLEQIKNSIEQQLSINTATGDVQSFLNPQSPNNLIYVPKINGQDPISVTELNMSNTGESDNKLLEHFQDKKLSVLGVPKEAMNFSSAEGLGNAGTVMSQRSALYANALQRLEQAYMSGWTTAFNNYFTIRKYSGLVGQFELHMNPVLTEMAMVAFDKRDSAISQATQIIDLMKGLKVDDNKEYKQVMIELLAEVLPKTSASIASWDIDATESPESEEF